MLECNKRATLPRPSIQPPRPGPMMGPGDRSRYRCHPDLATARPFDTALGGWVTGPPTYNRWWFLTGRDYNRLWLTAPVTQPPKPKPRWDLHGRQYRACGFHRGFGLGGHGPPRVPGLDPHPRPMLARGGLAGVRPALQRGAAAPVARPATVACPRAARRRDRGGRPAGSPRRPHPRVRAAPGMTRAVTTFMHPTG